MSGFNLERLKAFCSETLKAIYTLFQPHGLWFCMYI